MLSSYCLYLLAKYSKVKGPSTTVASLAFLLASFNGQYYMQKVIANTSIKCGGQGAC